MTGAAGQETGRKRPPHNSVQKPGSLLHLLARKLLLSRHFLALIKFQDVEIILKCTCH
jgi:hypothetical protein